jgi:hypothetical protein
MQFSQNGYPALTAGSATLHKWIVPGTDRYFTLRGGSTGFLLCHFILWFHEKIEKLNQTGRPWDDWAWAYRLVRGSNSTVSNHASGTAVDLNATGHPLGVANTFPRLARFRIRARLLIYRGLIRWGGDYTMRKDEMHFEINGSIDQCEKLAKLLMKTRRGKKILAANPGQRAVILS